MTDSAGTIHDPGKLHVHMGEVSALARNKEMPEKSTEEVNETLQNIYSKTGTKSPSIS